MSTSEESIRDRLAKSLEKRRQRRPTKEETAASTERLRKLQQEIYERLGETDLVVPMLRELRNQ